MQGTFTLPSKLRGRYRHDYSHPSVGPYPSTGSRADLDPDLIEVTENGDEIRHAWYQWVVFVLFFQAMLGYIPHFLWKS